MSHPTGDSHNIPNGIPPQWGMGKSPHQPMPQKQPPLNGLESSHSSRDPSPIVNLNQIPPQQLPPSRSAIPSSQLPPRLIPSPALQNARTTPIGLKNPSFTSTPNQSSTELDSGPISAFSPVTPNRTVRSAFTSTTSSAAVPPTFIPNVTSSTSATQAAITHNILPHQYSSAPSKNLSNANTVPPSHFPASAANSVSVNQSQNSALQTTVNRPYSNQDINQHLITNQTPQNQNQFPLQSKFVGQNPLSPNLSSQITSAQNFASMQNLQMNQQNQQLNMQSQQQPVHNQNLSIQKQPQYGHSQNSTLQNQMQHVHNQNSSLQSQQQPVLSQNLTLQNQQVSSSKQQLTLQNQRSLYQTSQNQSFIPTQTITSQPPMTNVTNGPSLQQPQPLYSQPPMRMSEVPLVQPQTHRKNSDVSNSVTNSNPFGPPSSSGAQPPQYSYPSQNNFNPNSPRFSVPPQPSNTISQMQQVPAGQPSRNSVHSNRYPPTAKGGNAQQFANSAQPSAPQDQYQSSYNQTYMQQNASTNNYQNTQKGINSLNQQFGNMNVVQSGFNKLWGAENYDLLQCPNILPPERIKPPNVSLGQEFLDAANCSPEIFRCTMTKIPESNSLLQKSRLPLGILIHPFKDLNHLPVIQCSTIVRCRACRTYINPFVFFVDSKRWKCNLCYRINELPEEFQYDPVSKSYGDPSRRPEVKSSTIEYIAPSEYMLRPPQPAVYLFLLDVSRLAIESGYLHVICDVLASQLETLPGDARTQIGIITFDSALHFFALGEGFNQPHEMTVLDIDDVFLPCPDNLLVNLKERMELIKDLLTQLPSRYVNTFDTGSALGAALQAAYKMMSGTGGRITVFQSCLPTLGPGALTSREDPNQRAATDAPHLNPATDFYKRLALDCSGQQIAVDLFLVNAQYIDLATISGVSRFSGGCIYHFPLFKVSRTLQAEQLERCFKRYLTRKIGFEAVMRIRCTRGMSIHTFHGNFFVRSTDLLSLPNINPDAGFGLQVAIEENLSDIQTVSFQAAVLYTSSKGERRIRVHTLCLPIVASLSDVLNSADQQCIIGLLSKMAVDRSLQSSLSDARDAFINVAIDILSSYKLSLNMSNSPGGLLAPNSLRLLPLYISALLKHQAFRTGTSTRLDDRVCSMCDMKTLPLPLLIQQVYPDLYPIHNLEECATEVDADGQIIPLPPRLQLSARSVDSTGAYLLDKGQQMIIIVCPAVSSIFLRETLGVPDYNSISDQFYELPALETPQNQALHAFISSLNDEKPYVASLQLIRENSQNRLMFIENLVEDRVESALSYHEFLQHLKTQVK